MKNAAASAYCRGQPRSVATGYLSNRMRQVVASYLAHDLACDWRSGAAWFESRLIDYDVFSNQGKSLISSSATRSQE